MESFDRAHSRTAADHGSLRSHFEELAYEAGAVTYRLDPRTQIAENPFRAVAGAFVAGALAGLRAGRPGRGDKKRGRVSGLVMSIAGTLAMRVVREVAMAQVMKLAKQRFADAARG